MKAPTRFSKVQRISCQYLKTSPPLSIYRSSSWCVRILITFYYVTITPIFFFHNFDYNHEMFCIYVSFEILGVVLTSVWKSMVSSNEIPFPVFRRFSELRGQRCAGGF
ncbi:hypothetical protein BGZ60DRAFT_424796 [Tricladium varicosporioides]|nr:hypothetical protein BGZ60DRAFT_424796 [Hymenoscyphus varicosporioides]